MTIYEPELAGFFGDLGMAQKSFLHSMHMDLQGMKGQLLSSSYMPLENEPAFAGVMRELQEVFDQYQENGMATMEYESRIYYNP